MKDQRFYQICPICEDILPGTSDGLDVYLSLVDQIKEIDAGSSRERIGCTLCGIKCDVEKARAIVAAAAPVLKDA